MVKKGFISEELSNSLKKDDVLKEPTAADVMKESTTSPVVIKGKGFKKPASRGKNLLIIGLGNIGSEYDSTRHNIGFRVLDQFAGIRRVSMKFTSKFNADYGSIQIGNKNVGLLKPGTFINNSGGPIKKIMENFKLTPKDILIIADDIAIDCGAVRLREKGSHGGHNGHRDIEAVLKTKEYSRLRVGISQPDRKSLVEHVLGEFSASERDLMSVAVSNCIRTIEDWIEEDDSQLVISRCNAQPPSK
jgi:PTH1 family peptidyl-tRNA hydrolase